MHVCIIFLHTDQRVDFRLTRCVYWSAAATPNLTVHVHWDGDKWAFLIQSFWELSVRLAQRIVGLTEEMEGGSVMSVRKLANAEVPYTCLLLFRPSTSFHLPSSPH